MSYKILAKYIKDLKFEIPNSKIFFLLTKNISNYKINIDIKSNQIKEKIIEVQTTLSLNPTRNDFEKINIKITHTSIVELKTNKLNKKELEEIILINVPEEIYSEIRQTFIFLFEKSGYKEIKIDKNVDFKKLYSERIVQ
jgi:preprotein translocase subunit SecB